jgi:mono/diheme cytochrome c family protein
MLLTLGLTLGSTACQEHSAEDPAAMTSPADPANAEQVAAGEAIYRTHCATCHGEQLQGQPNWQEALPDGGYPAPPHDGSGHTWRHPDQALFEATRYGGASSAGPDVVSRMAGFEAILSEDEIWATIAFIKSRWPHELLARQRLQSRMGKHHTGHMEPAR